MFESTSELRFAVLIDADNVSEKYIKVILDEISNAGVATYKRIYGDWTSPRLASWKSCLLDHSIIPMQQYSYTYGKNATDSAMIIDAMDILYSGTVDGFAIVSSDSDFTRLVARLRESGMVVIGSKRLPSRSSPLATSSSISTCCTLDSSWKRPMMPVIPARTMFRPLSASPRLADGAAAPAMPADPHLNRATAHVMRRRTRSRERSLSAR